MRKLAIFAATIHLTVFAPASATVINIPDDYLTIQEGIDASTDGDTVLVQPGTYVENVNFNGHNIVLGSLFLTTGDTSYISQTIIDGDSSGSVVTFENGEGPATIVTGFTIQNGSAEWGGGGIACWDACAPLIKNNVIIENDAEIAGGGIWCIASSPALVSNFIGYNSSQNGGGISYQDCYAGTMINCIITGNTASDLGGGIGIFYYSRPEIIGSVVSGNSAANVGGGILCYSSDLTKIMNNILWGNIAEYSPQILGNPIVSYCDIQGGWEGEGNIDVPPQFRNSAYGDFHLMSTACGDSANSPCIDAGDPAIIDSLLDCSWGLGEVRSDMGAYGGGDTVIVGMDDKEIPTPDKFMLFQNYPNPFNATTVIRYSLPEPADVVIDIFDILGRRVETIIDERQKAGYHHVVWNCNRRSAGIYLYRIQAGDYGQTRKMVLLK
jgi:hypothetical protein